MKKQIPFILPIIALLLLCGQCEENEGETQIDLPNSIKTYISANYSGYDMEEAEIEKDCNGQEVYEVELENEKTNSEIELTFEKSGAFMYSESELKLKNLPLSVKNSLNKSYPAYKIEEASKLAMKDGTTQYEVEIENKENEMELIVKDNGEIICNMTEKDDEDDA